jgi:WD40 repeat protein
LFPECPRNPDDDEERRPVTVFLACSLSAADEPPAKQADPPAVPKSIVGGGEGVQKVVWSTDGKFLAVLVNIYQAEEREVDSKTRTTLFDSCSLMLWDVAKKEWLPTTVRLDPKVRVLALAVSPDSKTLAFGLQDLKTVGEFEIRLVDVEKGKDKKSFHFAKEQGSSLWGLAFASNDTLAAWGSDVPRDRS